ncbi:putative glutathione synthetase [Aspergillus uvarum CBS 121591]|uniref:Glutathione synthetase n=1 Tax=Aspergillus uvarum CBS 121591 TaxID=1448315 RepID=A0A319C5F9_9EURO|nr:putative glutathione synthetase [Aspergillus uvarum CBS 121591]PYH79351.1 putative glutathione synthetase [Aspergillus uvarum CBS 121591]
MYPPPLSEEQRLWLAFSVQDWQVSHGSMLKRVRSQSAHSVLCCPIGVTLFPTPFPRAHFDQALELQSIYNELYCAMTEDEHWIQTTLQQILHVNSLAAALWEIHQKVKRVDGYIQNISCGIFRSDYMLQGDGTPKLAIDPADGPISTPQLKQVEFNTFSCAGASHAQRTVEMHRHFTRTGAYASLTNGDSPVGLAALPENNNIQSLGACLAEAHALYGQAKSKVAAKTAVLFVVQPQNFNIADERPVEYALWNRDSPVPAHRVEWGDDLLEYTSLSKTKELLFHPPWLQSQTPIEISVVYLRAGYEADEYDHAGKRARVRLETSRAIKCPSLLAQILTFKKVQQALAEPGSVERFLSPEKAAKIRKTFVPMYPLDESQAGVRARRWAADPDVAENFVLKPSLEGGGHNVYGADIPDFLASVTPSTWCAYILMERICSPAMYNVLMSPQGIDSGPVVSELGVIGTCIWKKRTMEGSEFLSNTVAGWSFKTKHTGVDEMSVVKGYGCFDTPLLY